MEVHFGPFFWLFKFIIFNKILSFSQWLRHIKMKKCQFWNMKIPMYIFDSEIAPFLKIHRRVYLKKQRWKSYLKSTLLLKNLVFLEKYSISWNKMKCVLKYRNISRTNVSVSLIIWNSSSQFLFRFEKNYSLTSNQYFFTQKLFIDIKSMNIEIVHRNLHHSCNIFTRRIDAFGSLCEWKLKNSYLKSDPLRNFLCTREPCSEEIFWIL